MVKSVLQADRGGAQQRVVGCQGKVARSIRLFAANAGKIRATSSIGPVNAAWWGRVVKGSAIFIGGLVFTAAGQVKAVHARHCRSSRADGNGTKEPASELLQLQLMLHGANLHPEPLVALIAEHPLS
jgi:hypothetical protein